MQTSEVFNPAHYGGKDNPYETIKVLEAWLTPDEMIGFYKGQSIAYQQRHRDKGGLVDLSKSLWYQQYLVAYLAKRSMTALGPNTIAPDPSPEKSPEPSSGDQQSTDKPADGTQSGRMQAADPPIANAPSTRRLPASADAAVIAGLEKSLLGDPNALAPHHVKDQAA